MEDTMQDSRLTDKVYEHMKRDGVVKESLYDIKDMTKHYTLKKESDMEIEEDKIEEVESYEDQIKLYKNKQKLKGVLERMIRT